MDKIILLKKFHLKNAGITNACIVYYDYWYLNTYKIETLSNTIPGNWSMPASFHIDCQIETYTGICIIFDEVDAVMKARKTIT